MASNNSSLVEQIKTVLRESTAPMSALDIGKKLGKTKKEINQLLYKITDTESVPETQPPLWKLKESQSSNPTHSLPLSLPSDNNSTGASPVVRSVSEDTSVTCISDSELSEKLAQLLTFEGQSAPDLYRKLGDVTISMSQVKRVLHDSNIATNIAPNKKSKPLWVKAEGKDNGATAIPLTLGGGNIYREIRKPGKVIFEVVTNESITTSKKEEEEEVKSKPSKINDELSDEMSTLNIHENKKEEITDEKLKQLILAHFRNNPQSSFTYQDLSQQLGQPTRDQTLYCLTLLVREGRVDETNDGLYTLKEVLD